MYLILVKTTRHGLGTEGMCVAPQTVKHHTAICPLLHEKLVCLDHLASELWTGATHQAVITSRCRWSSGN